MREPFHVTPYGLASRYLGIRECAGAVHNALVVAMLQLDTPAVHDDETPWCSAFVNWIAWNLCAARSRSLSARSWLSVGKAIDPDAAERGFHVVVLSRGGGFQPGPDVRSAPGHVGFFHGYDNATGRVGVLGGNQGNAVSVAWFPKARVLGVREI